MILLGVLGDSCLLRKTTVYISFVVGSVFFAVKQWNVHPLGGCNKKPEELVLREVFGFLFWLY